MLPKQREELRLLHAMGWETANIHLGDRAARPAIRRDLARRRQGWLRAATRNMVDNTVEDWKEWKQG